MSAFEAARHLPVYLSVIEVEGNLNPISPTDRCPSLLPCLHSQENSKPTSPPHVAINTPKTMADDGSNTGVFAQHYRTGKYADLTLIAKDGTQFNVHRLVVCTLSPVLDAQAADGVKTIEMNEDAATVGQLVKWMYGIDKKLLKNGNSVDEITAIGPNALYHEILVLAYFAKIAEKVLLLKIFLGCDVTLC
jgi:hypothetical protein